MPIILTLPHVIYTTSSEYKLLSPHTETTATVFLKEMFIVETSEIYRKVLVYTS